VVEQQSKHAEQQRIEEVTRRVDTYFDKQIPQEYQDLYGTSNDELTDEQADRRNKVLDTAYDLMVGASQLRGQTLSIEDALDRAHAIESKDYAAKAARKGVKKEAKKRNRGISQKPSRKKGSAARRAATGRPQSREELESRTKSRLKDTFGD
jgi:hypothetical protein